MKFLILWELNGESIRPEIIQAVMRMPDYGKRITDQGKLLGRYHMVGKHGGAWIYNVASNEELERLLAQSPVFNFSRYEVIALADMETPATIVQNADKK